MLIITAALAWADEPADTENDNAPDKTETAAEDTPESQPAQAEWFDINAAKTSSSALDTAQSAHEQLKAEDSTRLEDVVPKPLVKALVKAHSRKDARFRGRWGIRPWLGAMGVVNTEANWGGGAGVVLSHQWWPMSKATWTVVGQTRLQALFPFAGVNGWAVGLDSVAGPWFGPVGLMGGLTTRADAFTPELGANAQAAAGLGPTARLAARFWKLTPWVSGAPIWLVSGERKGNKEIPFDELELAAGMEIRSSFVAWRLSGARRQIAIGEVWQVALGLHLGPS